MIRGGIVVILAEKQREIEVARERLHQLVERKFGNFTDKEVADLSQYLDQLIVEYETANTREKKVDNLA